MNYDMHCDNVSNSIGKWLDRVFKHPRAIQIAEGSPLDKAIDAYRQAIADAIHVYEGKTPAQTYMEYVIGMRIGELDRQKFFGCITQAEYDLRKSEILVWGKKQLERIAENNLSVADLEQENKRHQIQSYLNTPDITLEQVRSIIEKARIKGKPLALASQRSQEESAVIKAMIAQEKERLNAIERGDIAAASKIPPLKTRSAISKQIAESKSDIEIPPYADFGLFLKKCEAREKKQEQYPVYKIIYPAFDRFNRIQYQLTRSIEGLLKKAYDNFLLVKTAWILVAAKYNPKQLNRLENLPNSFKEPAYKLFTEKHLVP